MCSKMSSGSYGGDRENDYSGLCPKKQKHNGRRKVPRRGPGVAELEKIRLEEQHISTVASLPPPPLPTSEKSHSTILPNPTTTNRTSPVYPFSSYFTTGNFPEDLIPPAPVFQRKHDSSLRYLPPMNLSNPRSGGFYQFIEPPSNQTSCSDNVSHFLSEEKIVTAKRPWNCIAETRECSVGQTITLSRDVKQTKSLDLRLKNHIQDSRTTIRNLISIDSLPAPITSNSSLDFFPRFIQEEEFDHEIMPRRTGANVSLKRKPFYSFFPSNEQSIRDQDPSFSLKTERYDTVTDHAIDLRLKL